MNTPTVQTSSAPIDRRRMDMSDARKNLVGDRTFLGLCRLLTGGLRIFGHSRIRVGQENIHQLLFVGNVLQRNNLSKKLQASAMKRWLNGHLNVLLLEHERFFSAVGVLLEQLNHTGPNAPAPQTLQRAMNTMRQWDKDMTDRCMGSRQKLPLSLSPGGC
ncbi:hypothetical protein COCON_G00052480 [Conger conger]|uniref:Uncharacterized protein n=1 Tax=Conger conger TaxID=82655 RepID=A0A9Q1DW56_CONCO|nr:hypothetical protein COCON_G00052480 [Conger conger]